MSAMIEIEGISKCYRLGVISRRTLRDELIYQWQRMRGRDPFQYLGKLNQQSYGRQDEFWALNDVSFSVAEGEVVGLIGGNGAGKSTLLKILTRITEPTQGRAVIRGRVGSLLEVGTGFHPELTGRENIYMNGTILGMRRHEIEAKFDEIVDFSGVEKFLDTPVKRYSSGMYVRLAFAVAAHLEPEVLLVDEVLAVGDAAFQKKCLGKMGEIASGGRTIIFVSHNMSAIKSLCSRCVWLENGTIKSADDMDTVVDSYMEAMLENSSGIKLSERRDRAGSGKVKATGLNVFLETQRRGWSIDITYESTLPSWKNPRILLSIRKASGELITYLDSACSSALSKSLPASGVVKVKLSPDFLFCPGEHICNLCLFSGNEKLDHVTDAYVFKSFDLPSFDWIKQPATKGLSFIQQSWTVE